MTDHTQDQTSVLEVNMIEFDGMLTINNQTLVGKQKIIVLISLKKLFLLLYGKLHEVSVHEES